MKKLIKPLAAAVLLTLALLSSLSVSAYSVCNVPDENGYVIKVDENGYVIEDHNWRYPSIQPVEKLSPEDVSAWFGQYATSISGILPNLFANNYRFFGYLKQNYNFTFGEERQLISAFRYSYGYDMYNWKLLAAGHSTFDVTEAPWNGKYGISSQLLFTLNDGYVLTEEDFGFPTDIIYNWDPASFNNNDHSQYNVINFANFDDMYAAEEMLKTNPAIASFSRVVTVLFSFYDNNWIDPEALDIDFWDDDDDYPQYEYRDRKLAEEAEKIEAKKSETSEVKSPVASFVMISKLAQSPEPVSEVQLALYDLSGDGTVDVVDIALAKRRILES